MSERTTVDRNPHKVVEKLHCICNLIANFFGYEFHVTVKLDRDKNYTIHVVESPREPVDVEPFIIPDEEAIDIEM